MRTRSRIGLAAIVAAVALALAYRAWNRAAPGIPSGGAPAVETALQAPIREFRCNQISFENAINALRDHSKTPIHVDWETSDYAASCRTRPVTLHLRNVTLAQALSALLGYVNSDTPRGIDIMAYTVSGDTIVIAPSNSLARHAYTRIYDVRDITLDSTAYWQPPPATQPHAGLFADEDEFAVTQAERDEWLTELIRLIQELVGPLEWRDNGGAIGSIYAQSGRLIVVTTWHNHRQIDQLLAELRRPATTPNHD
jgi:hypothetical protein